MAAYELTGTVKLIMDPQSFDSGFTKREFVVTTAGDRFPQDIKFECVREKTALLDAIQPGQTVTVSFDVRGNEYKGRYYVNLAAWRIEAGAPSSDEGPADDDGPPLDQLEAPPADDDLSF